MTDFDFVTMVFLIPGAVGALVVQNIAMRSDYESRLAKMSRPVFKFEWRVVELNDAPWWKFWGS